MMYDWMNDTLLLCGLWSERTCRSFRRDPLALLWNLPSGRFHGQLDCGPFVAVDFDVHERRPADQVDTAGSQKAPGDGDGLDGLIERARADGLDFDASPLSYGAGQRAGNRRGIGAGGGAKNASVALLLLFRRLSCGSGV